MGEVYPFHMQIKWEGGRLGQGKLNGEALNTTVSVPVEFNGPNVGSNPEELLIGSVLTCYSITLASLIENRKIPVESFTVCSEGIVSRKDGKLQFTKIIHRPTLILADGDNEIAELARKTADLAEQNCMIARSLRGNVEFEVEPIIEFA